MFEKYVRILQNRKNKEEEMIYGIWERIFVTMVTQTSFKIVRVRNFSCKQTLSFFIMEPQNEFSCIRVNVDDMASLEEVSELYFTEQEEERNEEDDSPWNDSSSESGEDKRYDDESEMFTGTSESDL